MKKTKKSSITNVDTERKPDTSLKKPTNATKVSLKKKDIKNIIAKKPRASLRKKEEKKEDTNAELPRDTS